MARGEAAKSALPTEFEEYRLLRPLGQGQMGQVFLAHDALLDRTVAIKFLAARDPDESMRRRLFTEARAIARIQHPNVVTVYRVGEVRGRPYLVSEYVRGQPLKALPKPQPARKVLELATALARGLAAAHRQGVLHRDLKPANVIVGDDGEVKLLDFGLAKLLHLVEPTPAAAPFVRAVPEGDPDATQSAELVRAPALDETRAVGLAAASPAPITVVPEASDPVATAPGLLGTPLYMAPELWHGEAASRQSDIYALGVLLFELLEGTPPFRAQTLAELERLVRARPETPIAPRVPDEPALAAVVERCLAAEPAGRYRTADELLRALEAIGRPAAGARAVAGPPYRGLAPFEAEHAPLFFGRGADVDAVVERLRTDPFVLVLGDSGVGKSSLCRAGVLPALGGATGPGERRWRTLSLLAGRAPLDSLAQAVAPFFGGDDAAARRLLAETPEAFARELHRRATAADAAVLLFVDQLEELVTLARAEDAATAARALGGFGAFPSSLRLLGTARSDFLTRLLELPGLGNEVPSALYLLRPLGREGLRDAVVRPAQAVDVRFESEAMVDDLVDSAERAPGGLPLLQFALAELWNARDVGRGVIPAAALAAMGGVDGALASHAERVFGSLAPEERAHAQKMLLRLVTAEGTRARRSYQELVDDGDDAGARRAFEALVRGRLVVVGESDAPARPAPAGRATPGLGVGGGCEIAHEALLRAWPRLASWLSEDVEKRAARDRVLRAAAEWERLGRAPEALLGGRQLAEIAALPPAELGPLLGPFVAASRRARRNARVRRLALLLAGPLSIAMILLAVERRAAGKLEASIAAHLAAGQRALAEARAARAEADRAHVEMQTAYDGNREDAGQERWNTFRQRAARADALYVTAGQWFDAGLRLDPRRNDLRALGAEVTYERALLAEREGRDPGDLLRSLPLHDHEGHFARRWAAPARLRLIGLPPGATVEIARVERAPGRPAVLVDRRAWPSPDAPLSLAPDGYLLVLAAPERARVTYPVVLARSESLTLEIELPSQSQIPPGFAYVPPGRFLFGGARDEDLRTGFLHTTPLRSVHTGAYLVAQHETTYADWMTFLEALPAVERPRRMPMAGIGGFEPPIRLERRPDGGYQLRLYGPKKVARAGAPVVHPRRDRRQTQDWRRFPVGGVSFRDAEAYAAWLSATGRVKRARLCTDHEWERAGRGADTRIYPHGDALGRDDLNHDATYDRDPESMGPDEVGSHPASRSPFGVDDLSGNVWEWVRPTLGKSPVLRGGDYNQTTPTVWLTNRQPADHDFRMPSVGIRICADL